MNSRASALIDLLALQPHPEGGYFREVFRSARNVRLPDGEKERSAITTIYFLLTSGECSRLHRIESDEVWHYYEGAELELYRIDEGGSKCNRCLLGPVGELCKPFCAVPAGSWQAARTEGDYTLVGCTVAPGFEFGDFQVLGENPEEERAIRERFPELAALI